jgi:hypothetical protein
MIGSQIVFNIKKLINNICESITVVYLSGCQVPNKSSIYRVWKVYRASVKNKKRV